MTHSADLYQQLIIDHSKKPRNFRKIEDATHMAEGYNPLCGDHLWVYLKVDQDGVIEEVTFEGSGCAISKASASLMTMELKGKPVSYAEQLFQDFHGLLTGQDHQGNTKMMQRIPPKLGIFSNIWQYPARVKCAALSWHAMNGALHPVHQESPSNVAESTLPFIPKVTTE